MAKRETKTPSEPVIDPAGIRALMGRALGEKAIKELVPHFWGFIETRPYMRARQALADELRMAGRLHESAQEYAEMLTLNENDNQGVHYELLAIYLAMGRVEEARALMERYPGDCDFNAVFLWGRVLERLLSDDAAGARKGLAAARKQNPHAEPYVTGRRKPPKSPPDSYSPGSREEAACYAETLAMAWSAHPEARAWVAKEGK